MLEYFNVVFIMGKMFASRIANISNAYILSSKFSMKKQL